MPGDLHTHTTFSDGSLPIAQLPPMAACAGMDYLSVTDHDTFAASRWALEHPVVDGVKLIPGIELSAWDEERSRKVHLLCYGANETPTLRRHVADIAASRNQQQRKSLQSLLQLYPFLKEEMFTDLAADGGVLFKAHLMRVLHEYGLTDTIYGPLYRQLLGRWGSCHASPTYRAPVKTLLRAARAAKAVVVLAHPGVYDSMDLAVELAKAGRIDGVEIMHPGNDPDVQIMLRNLAQQYGLLVTGGTDYHAMHSDRVCPIGQRNTSDNQLQRLFALMRQRHGLSAAE